MTVGADDMLIGYAPCSQDLGAPGDRRRFARYAKLRNIPFTLADPDETYDLVVVTQRADLTTWSRYDKGKVIFDFIDSYLAVPRTPRHLLRGAAKFLAGNNRHLEANYWKTLQRMCRRSAAVICSTQEQQAQVRPLCANVHRILDLPDPTTAKPKDSYDSAEPFRIVWEGLPENAWTLGIVGKVLARLHRETPLALHVVTDPVHHRWMGRFGRTDTLGALRKQIPEVPIELHPWSVSTLYNVATSGDVAIIPLPMEDPLYAGKPENKLLILWRLGLPVLTSATPAYVRAMRAAGIDLTCRTSGDWDRALRRLVADRSLRESAARGGRSFTEREYSEARLLAAWDAVIGSVAHAAPAAKARA